MNEPKFKVGDKVIVCNELETIIDEIKRIETMDGTSCYLYFFKDGTGKTSAGFEFDLEINLKPM